MSVSASNQAYTPSTDNFAQPSAGAQASPVAKAAGAAGPSFEQSASQSGPVFGSSAQSPTWGLNPGPPPRPNPTLPDNESQKNDLLARGLLSRYNAFKPWYKPTVTPGDIQRMADRPKIGNPNWEVNKNIELARDLLRRPDLMKALDRDKGTGALDNSLSREDIGKFILSNNPLKIEVDKELAERVMDNFNALKGPWWSADRNAIDVNRLKGLALRPPTGDASTDRITQLADELAKRSQLLGSMDNVNGFWRDGKITRGDLYRYLNADQNPA
ncbi:hypothetical protein IFT37_14520 [Pseudomonas fluorescens]|uniref:hypothetical protein n=1 Tax=Pseudomonas fluorescens TaxID=294 RepID=UPI0017836A2C|nr:hypothetical protein [Pseudomonas fluorescens]MBD8150919.1 hypothetical protein [Pseudomonas fluorescens]MBD8179807.1 hypothetical protein [Pseudomonas fluorescens]MBD8746319.1 hypothetical protein [Pseudomonas fluorescens]MBD8749917.1 hypothetical protein [Pseudomonas fluorescens]MBD8762577.1 hypothetical protein [Pseudomonas fluorescens]